LAQTGWKKRKDGEDAVGHITVKTKTNKAGLAAYDEDGDEVYGGTWGEQAPEGVFDLLKKVAADVTAVREILERSLRFE